MTKMLTFRPDGIIEERLINGEIEDEVLCEVLGGDIEEVPYLSQFESLDIAFLQNERAKLLTLEPTIRVVRDGKLVDVLCGNIVVVGTDEEDYIGLQNFQEDYIHENIRTATIAVPTPFLIIV